MSQGVLRADKAYRKRVLLVYAILVSLGALIIGRGLPWVQGYLQSNDPAEALQFMKIALALVFLGVLPIAFYMWSFGRKVVSSGQFPPPGARVIRDTKVLVGDTARQRGRVLIVLSLMLMLLGFIGALYMPIFVDKMSTRGAEIDGVTK